MKKILLLLTILLCMNNVLAKTITIKTKNFNLEIEKPWILLYPIIQSKNNINFELKNKEADSFIGYEIVLNKKNANALALSYVDRLKNKLTDFKIVKSENKYDMLTLEFIAKETNGYIMTSESNKHTSALVYFGDKLKNDLSYIFNNIEIDNEDFYNLFPNI